MSRKAQRAGPSFLVYTHVFIGEIQRNRVKRTEPRRSPSRKPAKPSHDPEGLAGVGSWVLLMI